MAVVAYIGLGGNLGRPEEAVRSGARALAGLSDCSGLRLSPLYRSAPLGPADQPDYVNAVARLITTLDPLVLLDALQAIEQAHGRVRGPLRWGPRTLDLDLLLFGGQTIRDPRLIVPHPGLAERCFVLVPLHDLEPQLLLPDGRPVAALAAACGSQGLVRLAA